MAHAIRRTRYRSKNARSERRALLQVIEFVTLITEMGRSDGLEMWTGPYSPESGMQPSMQTLTVQQVKL